LRGGRRRGAAGADAGHLLGPERDCGAALMSAQAVDQMASIEARMNSKGFQRRQRRNLLWHIPLALGSLVTLFPFYAMVIIALRPGQPIVMPDSLSPFGLSFDAFFDALASERIARWTLLSSIYALVSVVFVLLFASMAGYAFAKKRFLGRELMFWVFIAMLMVPGH